MAADKTSAFNCRYAVAAARSAGRCTPTARRSTSTRSRTPSSRAGGVLVRAFASVGWLWGGRWTSAPDWQHVSKTGG
ncbi:MAG TPA: M15 family metallopeptidase [Gaiellaceae bacterium]|nr:M15 family metallopeptidase [Gaiellaceae bacterium]